MAGLLSVSNFLITLIFSLILFVLWIRMIIRYFRVSALHPVSQVIYRFTNPLMGFIEKHIYPKSSRLPRYDRVCLAFIVIIECLKFLVLGWVVYQATIPFGWLLLLVAGDMIVQPCNLLFYALLIRVILSWVNPHWSKHPAADILILVTNPLIRLGQKIIPNISGFDFGPFIIMILLKVITLFISASMPLPLI
jgi:YggT family protein